MSRIFTVLEKTADVKIMGARIRTMLVIICIIALVLLISVAAVIVEQGFHLITPT